MFAIFNDLLNECHVGGDTSLAKCLDITDIILSFLESDHKCSETLERLD